MRQKLLFLFLMSGLAAFSQSKEGGDTTSVDSNGMEHSLGEVVVSATVSPHKLVSGGISTKVAGTVLSDAGTCFDVLAQLPGVRSSGGMIEVLGKGSPQIYVNGRLLLDMSELKRLSSKDIQNVEVLSNPGAKYGAEIESVILIKTVKKFGDGLGGSLQGSARLGHYLSQSDDMFLNYRIGGVDIFGSFNMEYSRRYQRQRNSTFIQVDEDDYRLKSNILIYPKSIDFTSKFGVNWQINKNHYVGVKYEYAGMPSYKSDLLTEGDINLNGSNIESVDYHTRWRGRRLPSNSLNLYYNGDIGPLSINVSNDYYYSHSVNNQHIDETSNVSGIKEIGSENNTKNTLLASKGVGIYEWKKNEVEIGYEISSTERRSVFIDVNGMLPNADDKISEKSYAGFATMTIPVGKIEIGAGLRYEAVISDYYNDGNFIPAQSRKYGKWYPNADFTFPAGNARFTLSYTSKSHRPLYSQLSSNIQYDDRFTYETGNPLLVSEYIHELSLAGIYRWIFFSMSYRVDKNAILSEIKPFEDGSPANVMTYSNFDKISKYNIVLSLSPSVGKWSPRLRFNLLGQICDISSVYGTKSMNNPVLFYNFYNTVSLWNFRFNADVTGYTSGDMDVVTLKPSWQINLGVSKTISNWFLQLQVTDIFKSARNSMITYGDRMILDKWNYSDARALRMMARYTFNLPASKYKGKSAGTAERQRM